MGIGVGKWGKCLGNWGEWANFGGGNGGIVIVYDGIAIVCGGIAVVYDGIAIVCDGILCSVTTYYGL